MSICSICNEEFKESKKNGGIPYKTCEKCRQKQKVKRERNKCKHGNQKYSCKLCGGNGICKHNKQKSQCKEGCGGGSLCIHGKIKSTCKEGCGGGSICIHGKTKSRCREGCGGGSYCEHGSRRSLCKKGCGGGELCEHNREKRVCKEGNCRGSSICKHNIVKYECKTCKGRSRCEHNTIRSKCGICLGGSRCEHTLLRANCIICNPKRACANCKSVYVNSNYRFKPNCFRCHCKLFPDDDIPKKYKFKEHHFRDFLKQRYKDVKMMFDNVIGPSMRRPDVLIKFSEYNVVCELDEYQHKDYSCEEKRMMQIFEDLGNKPLVMIRFNPDSYTNRKEEKINGCFTHNTKLGFIINTHQWVSRLYLIKKCLDHYIKYPPKKDFKLIQLFYDK